MYEKFTDSVLTSKEYWKKYADNYEGVIENEYHKERLEMAENLCGGIELSSKTDVLNFGCGGGALSLSLAKKFGVKIHGIDISDGMITIAKDNFKDNGLSGNFYVGDITSLNGLRDSRFDVILCINVLAYLEKSQDSKFYWRAL